MRKSIAPRRLSLATLAAGLLWLAGVGCGHDMRFVAPPHTMLPGGVSVTFQKAEASDDEMHVRFWITNASSEPMVVNRDGFALRLPTGEVLERRGMVHDPYTIPPGTGRNVWVKFESRGFHPNRIANASVIVGGISYQNDPIPRVVGEIPLTNTGPAD